MPLINLFWDNQELSKLEKACILSYHKNNNTLQIFTYKPELFDVFKDSKISIINANEILPEKEKFYYTGSGDCIEGSVVGFSDIFRYELLHKVGGWYSDFDVINLNDLSELDKKEIIIRPHSVFGTVCNIAKFPKGHNILKELKLTTQNSITSKNNKWVDPIVIFNNIIWKNKLNEFIAENNVFGDDNDKFQRKIIFDKMYSIFPIIKNFYCVHICASAFKTGNKNIS